MGSVKKDKGRKTLKSERGIEGLNLQELLRRKNESAEERKKAIASKKTVSQRPATKAGKKADLNSRLRELRKKRKQKDEQKTDKPSGGKKSGGANKKKGGKKAPNKQKKGGGKKKSKNEWI